MITIFILNSVYFKKFNYNSSLNAIQYIFQNNIEFQYNSGSYISCHLINYLIEKSIICSITQYLNSNYYINISIFDTEDNFNILKTIILQTNSNSYFDNLNSALMKKENYQKILVIYSKVYIYWIGYDINLNELNSGIIYNNNGCTINSDFIELTYFDETEEFIASFINICNINGNNYKYIFIYSFNTNFEVSFLGAVRNFTIDDSCINCNPFNFIYLYNIYEISHSILFSTITQRYSFIGNIKDNNSNNGISLFILNKDINIINPKEIEISYSLEFICEDYSNFNNSNYKGNIQLINEINNNKIRFIEKCNHDFNKINSTCSFLKYNLKTFNITYNKIYSEFSSTNINSDIIG